ncbi:MAG: hydroxymethylbilane synthase [Nitrospirae bacterium]|nr:hydroxymethylbilane synthase [Nitrospirota bacterium]
MVGPRSSIIIGTRGSRLALWQAEFIQAKIQALAPHLTVTLQVIKTSGDKILDVPLAKIGGKGLFVKEIEEALLAKNIDLAVHSMKDVPSDLPKGLALLSFPKREDPRDALLSRTGLMLQDLPKGSRIGTSSLRRQSQLLRVRPDFSIQMLRGNLDTRLRKLDEGEYDAIVLAAAGLKRLGWADRITEYLSPEVCLPAIGQGALGLEGRDDDPQVKDLLLQLDDPETRKAVAAERKFLDRLEGGCQVPIAGLSTIVGTELTLDGLVAGVDGTQIIRDTVHGALDEGEALGHQLAERIIEAGGKEILDEIYGRT